MNKQKQEKIEGLFANATDVIRQILSPDPDGETTNECFVLLKDLAHCGGTTPSPISIMRAGTVFRKQIDSDYFSDGFHLIARHVAEWSEDYFLYLSEKDAGKVY